MPHWRVLLSGENLWLRVEGEWTHLGFFTTRWVEATDAAAAAGAAVDNVQRELNSRDRLDSAGQPTIQIEEIEPVERIDRPGAGFTFYLPGSDG